MLRRVALVRTDVSEEPGASFIRVIRIGELGTTQAATSNWCMLQRNWLVLTRATWRNIPEDTILQWIYKFGNLLNTTLLFSYSQNLMAKVSCWAGNASKAYKNIASLMRTTITHKIPQPCYMFPVYSQTLYLKYFIYNSFTGCCSTIWSQNCKKLGPWLQYAITFQYIRGAVSVNHVAIVSGK
jgi:hypothetical protein